MGPKNEQKIQIFQILLIFAHFWPLKHMIGKKSTKIMKKCFGVLNNTILRLLALFYLSENLSDTLLSCMRYLGTSCFQKIVLFPKKKKLYFCSKFEKPHPMLILCLYCNPVTIIVSVFILMLLI